MTLPPHECVVVVDDPTFDPEASAAERFEASPDVPPADTSPTRLGADMVALPTGGASVRPQLEEERSS